MYDIKDQISEWMKVERSSLYEIGLEDVEFSDYAEKNIHMTIQEMLLENESPENTRMAAGHQAGSVPCMSYWIEKTRELIIFLWNKYQYKALIVPKDAWMIRTDITIH
jgi:hypothetical protein